MQESDTYLMILEEGMAMHARKAIVLLGEQRLGPPEESVKARLEDIPDLKRLDLMICRALEAGSWQEILDTP